MIIEMPKFKTAIRVLKMVRNELEQSCQENIKTLNHDQKQLLYDRIREIDEAIIVLETYKEDNNG